GVEGERESSDDIHIRPPLLSGETGNRGVEGERERFHSLVVDKARRVVFVHSESGTVSAYRVSVSLSALQPLSPTLSASHTLSATPLSLPPAMQRLSLPMTGGVSVAAGSGVYAVGYAALNMCAVYIYAIEGERERERERQRRGEAKGSSMGEGKALILVTQSVIALPPSYTGETERERLGVVVQFPYIALRRQESTVVYRVGDVPMERRGEKRSLGIFSRSLCEPLTTLPKCLYI
ncbi:hypothetical protein KIPB_013468, partial [Kipferlia bialata]